MAGNVTLTNCTISGNSAQRLRSLQLRGGLFHNDPAGATTTLTNCTVSGNYRGGVAAYPGTTTLTNTIVAGNSGRRTSDGPGGI